MGIDQGIVDKLSQDITQRRTDVNQLQALGIQMGEAYKSQQEAQKSAGMVIGNSLETVESFAFKQKAELERQVNVSRMKEDMDYDALSFDIARSTAQETRNMMDLAETVKEKSSVSLWDSPVTAFSNAFTLPWDQQALAGSQQKLDLLNQAKEKLDSRVLGAVQVSEKTARTVSEATLASTTAALAASFTMQANDLQMKAIASGQHQIKLIAEGTAAETHAILEKQKYFDTEEARALRRVQMKEANELAAMRLQEKKQTVEGEAAIVAATKLGMQQNGVMHFPDDKQILIGLRTKNKVFETYYERGTLLQMGGTPSQGETPIEREVFRSTTGWQPKTLAEQGLAKAVSDITVAAVAKNKGNPAAGNTLAGEEIERWMNTKQQNVVPGDVTNPLAPPSNSAFNTFTRLQKISPKGYEVLQKLAAEQPEAPIHPQLIFNKLADQVAARTLSADEGGRLFEETYKLILAERNESLRTTAIAGRAFKEYRGTLASGSGMPEALSNFGTTLAFTSLPLAASGVGLVPALGTAAVGGAMVAASRTLDNGPIDFTKSAGAVTLMLNQAALRKRTEPAAVDTTLKSPVALFGGL